MTFDPFPHSSPFAIVCHCPPPFIAFHHHLSRPFVVYRWSFAHLCLCMVCLEKCNPTPMTVHQILADMSSRIVIFATALDMCLTRNLLIVKIRLDYPRLFPSVLIMSLGVPLTYYPLSFDSFLLIVSFHSLKTLFS